MPVRRLDENAITESLELRWFFRGQLPGPLLEKFKKFAERHNLETSKESRSDYYLKNKRQTVGVKLRKDGDEKDIELKFLKASAPHDEHNASGQVERWRKWRFPASKFNFRNERSVLESEWVAMSKVRYLTNIPSPSSKSKNEGCGFELTSITSPQGSFWTIGFEAFSESNCEESNFLHAVNVTSQEFFATNASDPNQESLPIRYSKDNSFSYPKFITETLLK